MMATQHSGFLLTTLTVDDCWSIKDKRDPVTKRMIPDPIKFPDGIAGVADEVHRLGLKVGIYSSTSSSPYHFPDIQIHPDAHSPGAGTQTCAGYPASLGYERIDAETFADWGIDCTCPCPPRPTCPILNPPSQHQLMLTRPQIRQLRRPLQLD